MEIRTESHQKRRTRTNGPNRQLSVLAVHHRQRRKDQNGSSKCPVEKPECDPLEFHSRSVEDEVDPQI